MFHARENERKSPNLVEVYLFYQVGSWERQLNQQRADFQLPAQKKEQKSLLLEVTAREPGPGVGGQDILVWGVLQAFTSAGKRAAVTMAGAECPKGLQNYSDQQRVASPRRTLSNSPHKFSSQSLRLWSKYLFAIVAPSDVLFINKPQGAPLSIWAAECSSRTTDKMMMSWHILLGFYIKVTLLLKQLHILS